MAVSIAVQWTVATNDRNTQEAALAAGEKLYREYVLDKWEAGKMLQGSGAPGNHWVCKLS